MNNKKLFKTNVITRNRIKQAQKCNDKNTEPYNQLTNFIALPIVTKVLNENRKNYYRNATKKILFIMRSGSINMVILEKLMLKIR